MIINTNITSLIVQHNQRSNQQAIQTAMQRLSSGLRINSAKDDPAGQAIANRMTAQIRGLDQAARNTADGISLTQTMEGGLGQINDSLQRIRQLAVQGASDTHSADDRATIVTEINAHLAEIDRVAASNKFNGIELLSGEGALNIQVGANTSAHDVIQIHTLEATTTGLGLSGSFALNGSDVHSDFQGLIGSIDSATQTLDTHRATLGATLNRFDSVIDGIHTTKLNLSAARSRIMDADYAQEASNLVRAQILQQVGYAILAQANQQPALVLQLLR